MSSVGLSVSDDTENSQSTDAEWGRRRTNLRHRVSVPAIIADSHGNAIECVIEDLSATGMMLSLDMLLSTEKLSSDPGRDPLSQGAGARLFFPPDPIDEPHVTMGTDVEVMWRAPTALGVRFTDESPDLQEALASIAAAAVSERMDESELSSHELTTEQRAVMRACRKALQNALPNLVWVMRTELVRRLRASAAEDKDNEVAEAADIVESKSLAISRTAEHEILQGFSEASDLEQTQELTIMQIQSAVKSKAAEKSVDVESADKTEQSTYVKAVAHTVEERYKTAFFQLNIRLANVLGRPLNQKSNTLVPGQLVRLLWEAVAQYIESRKAQKQLQQVMLHNVMPLIGELYETLHKTLDDAGASQVMDVRQTKYRGPRKN